MDVAGPNSLIRLLRAAEDPPQPNGLSKIAIATRVWSDSSDLPGKAEIIRDWIYSIWNKDTKRDTATRVFDKAYLDLLALILHSTSESLPTQFLCRYLRSRSLKTASLSADEHELWKEGVRRSSAPSDAWLEVWIEMVKCLAKDGSSLAPALVHTVEVKLEDSINLMPISKKNILAVQDNLAEISKAFASHPQLDSATLGSIMYPVGSFKVSKTYLGCIKALPSSTATMRFIPRLLSGLESAVRKHRFDIFIQPTTSKIAYQTYINGKTRSLLCNAIGETQVLLASIEAQDLLESKWKCRRDVWQCVASWGVYVETEETWNQLLSEDVARAEDFIVNRPNVSLIGAVLSFLTTAEELDHKIAHVDATTLAWCLTAPDVYRTEAEGVLLATFRYHRLSQTLGIWFATVLASIGQLLQSTATHATKHPLHRSIVDGPLLGENMRGEMKNIRKTKQVVDELLSQIRTVVKLDVYSAVLLDALSRLAFITCREEASSIDRLVVALEALILPMYIKGRSEQRESYIELSLAALVRLGRVGNEETRARLDSEFDLVGLASTAATDELRKEICHWLIARLGDSPINSDVLLDSLWTALQQTRINSTWDVLDREGLIALETLASSEQLNTLLARRPSYESLWLLNSAEVVELPRILDAILESTLSRMSDEQHPGALFTLLASLPNSVLGDSARQRILQGAQTAEAGANCETICTIRRALVQMMRGTTTLVDLSYFRSLQSDAVKHTDLTLQACSKDLIKTFMISAMNSDIDLERLLQDISENAIRSLVAEVAVVYDVARIPAKVKSLLARTADQMCPSPTSTVPPQVLLSLIKFRHWIDASVTIAPSSVGIAHYHNLDLTELELLRLECRTDEARLEFIQLLMAKGDTIPDQVLHEEVMALGTQTLTFEAMLRCCLTWLSSRGCVGTSGGFAVLTELLGIRLQGSGKAILRCRNVLLDTLLSTSTRGQLGSGQLRAIRHLVRLRSKMLRVADMARIVTSLSYTPNAVAVDIIHAAVIARSDLMVHVLPLVARFLCNALDLVHETSVISLSRLLSTLGKRPQRARDARLPFGKHAPAVLLAYVRNVSRPHTPLSIASRKTLQTSVYTICDAVIHSQDRGREGEGIGVPYGLGENGEAEQEIWADLWRQWSKQRYKGQG